MSCIVGGYHANYHVKQGTYVHEMGIREGGNLAILAGAGPMGLGAVDYAVHCDRKPALVVVTDIDTARLDRAASIVTPEEAAAQGVKLVYLNTNACEDAVASLRAGAFRGRDGGQPACARRLPQLFRGTDRHGVFRDVQFL